MNNIEKKKNQTKPMKVIKCFCFCFCFCFLLYLLRKKYDDAKAKQKTEDHQILLNFSV